MHAAGVLRHQMLQELTPAQLDEVLRPKLGAWLLHQALEQAPLDFFVLFSSASALLSSPKLGAYAAANCFLDAFAEYRHGLGKPALSVNCRAVWGGEQGWRRHVLTPTASRHLRSEAWAPCGRSRDSTRSPG